MSLKWKIKRRALWFKLTEPVRGWLQKRHHQKLIRAADRSYEKYKRLKTEYEMEWADEKGMIGSENLMKAEMEWCYRQWLLFHHESDAPSQFGTPFVSVEYAMKLRRQRMIKVVDEIIDGVA